MVTPLVKPVSMLQPFARAGSKNTIPNVPDAVPGHASMQLGFPPITMQRIEEGGKPPSGLDFNGMFNYITQHVAWQNAGGLYTFDADLVAFTGGYRKGAVIASDDGLSSYVSLVDNNTVNFNTTPNSIGSAWLGYGGKAVGGSTSPITLTGGTVTLTPEQYTAGTLILSGALTSNAIVVMPTLYRTWAIVNNCTGLFTVTVKTAAGAGVIVTRGQTDSVVFDGANIDYVLSSAVTQPALTNSKSIATTEYVDRATADLLLAATGVRYVNSAINAGSYGDYWVDTTAGAFAITLPENPVGANPLFFRDVSGTWEASNLTIVGSGRSIGGVVENLVCNVSGEAFGIWFNAATNNWSLI